jgi:hypothetical protein
MLKYFGAGAALLFVFLLTLPAAAEPIFIDGANPDLDSQMQRHGRQFYFINALPFGLSLDGHVTAENESIIDDFLAQQASDDFEAVTGFHPYDLLDNYGEFGDLGFFGGVAVAATAYEYLTLKRDGAPEAELAQARARVVHAAESWHVFKVVTGGNGLVARGIRRRTPEDAAAPAYPGDEPELIALADGSGNALPQPKDNGSWRDDNSGGELPDGDWIWVDSCSKDQLVGQVFAMTVLYDAIKDDPDIDQALADQIGADASLIGEMLMEKREISDLEGATGNGEYDLIIMDADGRPTMYHDLNPLSLEKLYFDEDTGNYNLFNLIMALGLIKGLHHVSSDERLEEFLYLELMHNRDLLGKLNSIDDAGRADYIYRGAGTNFDVPDMTSIALWLAIYFENDAEITTELRTFLEESWWRLEGETHTAALSKQPLWHAIYMTLTDRGVAVDTIDENADLLLGFDLGPYWNPVRENCDEDETAALQCLAIDGETILYLDEDFPNTATEALHPSIRPPSNFDARSNPFSVNGGGGNRLNPGGDLLASYWICRYMQANVAGEINVSPFARDHMPVGGWPADGNPDDTTSATTDGSDDSGCTCRHGNLNGSAGTLLVILFLMSAFGYLRKRIV